MKKLYLLLVLLFCTALASPGFAKIRVFDTSLDSWGIMGGYGQSEPSWGETTQRVQTFDIIPRYQHIVWDDFGSGWYQGYHSVIVELPASIVVHPDTSCIVAMNVLGVYTFTASKNFAPYIFGGGGPVYSFADIPGMGADWNGNYQFGGGVMLPLSPSTMMNIELRYHHISNAGSEEPNEPLNSWKILMGFSF